MNGMSISFEQIKNASANWSLNLLTQAFSMGFIPTVAYFLTSKFVNNHAIRGIYISINVLID